MADQKQDNTLESTSVQGVEEPQAQKSPEVTATTPPPAKPMTKRQIICANIDDYFAYVNWALGDKERLKFETIFDKRNDKFFRRFNTEANRYFVLTVRLKNRRERIAARDGQVDNTGTKKAS